MVRFCISAEPVYDEPDDATGASPPLHSIAGAVVGLGSDDWPRYRGRPMQHAFTIDLAELGLDIPRARTARAVAVFIDSRTQLDHDSTEGITVVWLSQDQVDAHPTTTPPADFVAEEPRAQVSYDEDGGSYEEREPVSIVFDPLDEDEEPEYYDSFIGGEPAWNDTGEPEALPGGAFVLQVNASEFMGYGQSGMLVVFEQGGYLQADPDDERAVPWSEAIARSRELVLGDSAPPADTLQKWGGLPRGVSEYDWPKGMTHLLTYVPEEPPENMEGVALALFGRLSKKTNWGQEAGFYETRAITQEELDEAEPPKAPDGVPVLEERALLVREFPEGTSWRDLQSRCFVGPRPAWRDPTLTSSSQTLEQGDIVLQLTEAVLPVTPGPGTLHFLSTYTPIWHAAPHSAQATAEVYVPRGSLYTGETTAAIVVGHPLAFEEFAVLPEQVEALERGLLAALDRRGHSLTLYVPGDTTDRNQPIHGGFVLGRSVVEVEANDLDPGRIHPAKIREALAELPTLDEAFWGEALAGIEGLRAPAAAAAHLLSWGPLCYGSVLVGAASTRDAEPKYKFVANQDMNQEWSSAGVDGVSLTSCEFSDHVELALGEADLSKVSKLAEPGWWLICRYD